MGYLPHTMRLHACSHFISFTSSGTLSPLATRGGSSPELPGTGGQDVTELGCHSTALGPDLNSVNPGSASAERKGARVARQRCAPGPTPGAVLCPAVRRGALQTVGRPAPASASGARGPPLLRAPLSSLPRPRPWPPANPEHRPTSSPRGCGGSWIGPPGACADTPPPPRPEW